MMRGEFHEVRKTVEAFSNQHYLEMPEEGKQHVGGLAVLKNQEKEDLIVGVRTKTGQVSRYKITLFE